MDIKRIMFFCNLFVQFVIPMISAIDAEKKSNGKELTTNAPSQN